VCYGFVRSYPCSGAWKRRTASFGESTLRTPIPGLLVVIGLLGSNVPDQEKDHWQAKVDEKITNHGAKTHLGLLVYMDLEAVNCVK
jgi:hypothetical protein